MFGNIGMLTRVRAGSPPRDQHIHTFQKAAIMKISAGQEMHPDLAAGDNATESNGILSR
jgi:hypothetical protein